MPKYHLSEKLQAVRESLTYEEMNLLCQERVNQLTDAVYKAGIEEGRARLIKEQRNERERRKERGKKQQWVTCIYFIRSPSAIKIGMAKCAKRRLMVLQTSHPDELELLTTVPGGRKLEAEYHQRFDQHRVRGEWFEPHADILAEITHLTNERNRHGRE